MKHALLVLAALILSIPGAASELRAVKVQFVKLKFKQLESGEWVSNRDDNEVLQLTAEDVVTAEAEVVFKKGMPRRMIENGAEMISFGMMPKMGEYKTGDKLPYVFTGERIDAENSSVTLDLTQTFLPDGRAILGTDRELIRFTMDLQGKCVTADQAAQMPEALKDIAFRVLQRDIRAGEFYVEGSEPVQVPCQYGF